MGSLQVKLALEAMSDRPGIEYAWRVHGALDAWTGKVDTKASISLAIESATVGFVLTLAKHGERLNDLHGLADVLAKVGLACLLVAIGFAVRVVMPQLDRKNSKDPVVWNKNTIYFGHLRHWEVDDLTRKLAHHTDEERQLARQLKIMSEIAWKKHARLQWSLWFLLGGGMLLGLALLVS
jgi:hypothetical protein